MCPSLIVKTALTRKELEDYKLNNGGSIKGFPGAEETTENLLTAECDILIPAAGEKQITAEIAEKIQAKVVHVCIGTVCVCRYSTCVCRYST